MRKRQYSLRRLLFTSSLLLGTQMSCIISTERSRDLAFDLVLSGLTTAVNTFVEQFLAAQ